jgi:hypothetical protein
MQQYGAGGKDTSKNPAPEKPGDGAKSYKPLCGLKH